MRTLASNVTASVFCCSLVFGQAVSQISGTVRDQSGAVVPGVEVKATQTDTEFKRTVVTGENGSYVLTNVPLGPYRLEATKSGFRPYVQTGIELQVASNAEIPITLGVGEVTQQVQVEANVSQVETRSAGVGTVIENQRIIDLPLNGRQPTDLITLSGAAVQGAANPSFAMRTGVQISVAGGDAGGVQYNFDGSNYVNPFDGTGMILPFPDALQEFKLSTSAQDASNSGRSGAVVNAVTKSGTNAFHGDAFEFIRNYDLNARDFFAAGRDGLKRNQFGGTFGGPFKKDKIFFFLGYQGATVRQTPIAAPTFVPTPQMFLGDFTTFASPQCQNGKQVALKAPFVNNQVSPSLMSPAAIKIAKLLPPALNACGTFLFGTPLHENDNQAPVRVDYQLSGRQTLFARHMLSKQQAVVPYTLSPNDVLTAGGVGNDDQANSITLGDTYLIRSNVVNSARLFFNRISAILPGANMFGPENVGINAYTYQPNYLTIPVTGGFSLGSGNFSENSFAYTTTFGANEDFSIVHGTHLFAFGGYAMRTIEWSVAQAWSGGSYSISGGSTGLGLADFFMGDVAQFRQANPNPLNLKQNFFALYAADTWKINRKLTMSYGINWAPFSAMRFPQGDLYNFNLGAFFAGTRSTVIPSAPLGFTYPGDPGFNDKSGINSTYGNVDPRVGLAWDPIGDGRTAIRIGAGVAHDFIQQDLHLNTSSALPFRLTVVQTGINLDNPFPTGDPFPYSFNPKNPVYPTTATAPCLATTCPPSFLPVPENMKTHVQYSWNLGIQRQFTPSWFASVTYLGSHIVHIWNAVELNPALYIPGNCSAGQYGLIAPGPCTSSSNVNQRRVLNLASPGSLPLGYMTQYDDGGTQGYTGLLLTTTWRLQNNVTLNANYTWSHCIGLPLINLLNPGANYIHQGYGQNIAPADRNLDMGDCAFDRRQIANVTLVAVTPKFSNNVARIVGTGWTFASTVVARSGAPFTLVSGTSPDPATSYGGNAPGTQRLNLVNTNTASAIQGQACANLAPCVSWLNPAAFAAPALGTMGNMGVNDLLGPGFWQWDAALSRQFPVREGQRVEIRVEGFNLTNSLRLGNPGTTLGAASTFGVVTADATPTSGTGAGGTTGSSTNAPSRVMQFALKYVF
jgi:Carboxypeptidase regulatory-like domain